MKYVNQLDYPHLQYVNQTSYEDPAARERGRQDTIATAGCGLCCSIMVADRLRVLNGDYEVEVLSRGFGRTSVQVIQEETAKKREFAFFLFWRK